MNTVKQNRDDYGMPLKILSYKDLYGWTMDAIVEQVTDYKFKNIYCQSNTILNNSIFFYIFIKESDIAV